MLVICKNCRKQIERTSSTISALEWRHEDGYFSCDGRRGHSETFADPLSGAPPKAAVSTWGMSENLTVLPKEQSFAYRRSCDKDAG
jgi:hypothetical protein